MVKKNITKFPEGFFQQKRPIISAGEAVKGLKPFEWDDIDFDEDKTKKAKDKFKKNKK